MANLFILEKLTDSQIKIQLALSFSIMRFLPFWEYGKNGRSYRSCHTGHIVSKTPSL